MGGLYKVRCTRAQGVEIRGEGPNGAPQGGGAIWGAWGEGRLGHDVHVEGGPPRAEAGLQLSACMREGGGRAMWDRMHV